MIHGLKPGPVLFTQNAAIVYSFILSLFVSNLVFVPVGLFIAKYCVRLIETPPAILGPIVIGLAVVGSLALNLSVPEIWIMLGIGLVGWLMKGFDVPREPLVLGLVLGTMAEGELARALSLVHGDMLAFVINMFKSPICLVMIALTSWSILKALRKK